MLSSQSKLFSVNIKEFACVFVYVLKGTVKLKLFCFGFFFVFFNATLLCEHEDYPKLQRTRVKHTQYVFSKTAKHKQHRLSASD